MYFGVCSDSVKTRDFFVLDNYIETVSKKILCLMEKVGGKDDVSGLGIGAPNGNYYNGSIEYAVEEHLN